MTRPCPPRVEVVGLGVSLADLPSTAERVVEWSREGVGRYACLANVHVVMEAHDAPSFRAAVSGADLVLPDGMPLVWAQRLLGHRGARRVPGPQLTEALLARAAERGVPVGFFGGTSASLERLRAAALARWPGLRIAVAIAPPFRPITAEEDLEHTRHIAASGAGILFVGIGCPKQERWMAEHAARIPCAMLGVGQAFDILSGVKRDAPRWMQRAGLGWLFRLVQEPRRLWRRYARHNPRFLALLFVQVLRARTRR